MSTRYTITIEAPLVHLPAILQALTPEARLLSIKETDNAAPRSYVGGHRSKGITGRDLLLKTLETGAKSMDKLQATFISTGFAPKSLSPVLSKLRSEGLIKHGPAGISLNNRKTRA